MPLRISGILFSLQGETSRVGLPAAFVRLTGYPLRCSCCDTACAFHGGHLMDLDAVLAEVAATGALDISAVDAQVSTILDLMTPSSGEASRNLWQNPERLDRDDEVKFVLCDEADHARAKSMLEAHSIAARCPVLFSPSFHQLPAATLAGGILRDRLAVRMQVQLHKQLRGEAQAR